MSTNLVAHWLTHMELGCPTLRSNFANELDTLVNEDEVFNPDNEAPYSISVATSGVPVADHSLLLWTSSDPPSPPPADVDQLEMENVTNALSVRGGPGTGSLQKLQLGQHLVSFSLKSSV
ncbi:hypothetical protein C8R47DRAFT_1071600 [Mycena vitilis]|nr:hypothetical protein C8R47DRAFT_1071600 [Mycena vitilis]